VNPVDQLSQHIQEATGVSVDDTSRRERIDITKTALREVLKEWLDERFKEVGKWTARGLLLAGFAAFMYFVLTHSGWVRS
jgi:hypothetical protein